VSNWPKLPAGMYFGLKDAPPPPASAKRRRRRGARGVARRLAAEARRRPLRRAPEPAGISGLAIDAQDHIYVFNRA